MFAKFDPSEWFQIDAKSRAYIRQLLAEDMRRHEIGSDEHWRAVRISNELAPEIDYRE